MAEPEAGPLLEWLLADAPELREMPETAPDDDSLVAYLASALAPEEAANVERLLTRHAAARRRLAVLAAQVEALQAQRVPPETTDPIALLWLRHLGQALAAASRARTRWAQQGWDRLQSEASADRQAAWTGLRTFAALWDARRAQPQWAVARSTTSEPVVLPDGTSAQLIAEATSGGDMIADLVPDTPLKTALASPLWLCLAVDDDVWPLAPAAAPDGRVAWRLQGFAARLGLPAGPVTGLQVRVDPFPTTVPFRRFPAASASGAPIWVELRTTPSLAQQRLRVDVVLPPATRQRQAQAVLRLSIAVTSEIRQRLGAWPVSLWADDRPQTLDMPCPGPDGPLDPVLLHWEFDAEEA